MILWLLGGGKKTFFDVPFFSKKTLPGTKANPEVAKAQLHPLPGRGSQGVIHSTGRSDRLHCDCEPDFFHGFFSVLVKHSLGKSFKYNKNETHGSLKILTTHTVFHTYLPMRFFGIFPVLQSLKEKSTFHKTHRLSSKRAQEGRRWVLIIKTSCFAYFNDVSGWCLVSVKWWICNETCLNMPKCLVTSVKCWWFWNLSCMTRLMQSLQDKHLEDTTWIFFNSFWSTSISFWPKKIESHFDRPIIRRKIPYFSLFPTSRIWRKKNVPQVRRPPNFSGPRKARRA